MKFDFLPCNMKSLTTLTTALISINVVLTSPSNKPKALSMEGVRAGEHYKKEKKSFWQCWPVCQSSVLVVKDSSSKSGSDWASNTPLFQSVHGLLFYVNDTSASLEILHTRITATATNNANKLTSLRLLLWYVTHLAAAEATPQKLPTLSLSEAKHVGDYYAMFPPLATWDTQRWFTCQPDVSSGGGRGISVTTPLMLLNYNMLC